MRRIRNAHPSRVKSARRIARTWARILRNGRRPMPPAVRAITYRRTSDVLR